ncbi:extracellular matrix protein 1 [Gouania willdenowi]|uniref:extracellular matrix protein 1 n=1 Tax=Gouania willdenowi TaxID=441366 RepID=UPI001055E968|nr:extracellular matrix protein 1-like [Gouania willdenowi]
MIFIGFWITVLMAFHCTAIAEAGPYTLNEPDMPFPPALPTAQNLQAICHSGGGRPRYPDSFFPSSGSSHFRRIGAAVNRLESWFTLCCSGTVAQTNDQILCCATQAWKQALSLFCKAEYSTMTLVYECCEYKDEAKWTCFDDGPANPLYNPTPGYAAPNVSTESGLFSFDSSAC